MSRTRSSKNETKEIEKNDTTCSSHYEIISLLDDSSSNSSPLIAMPKSPSSTSSSSSASSNGTIDLTGTSNSNNESNSENVARSNASHATMSTVSATRRTSNTATATTATATATASRRKRKESQDANHQMSMLIMPTLNQWSVTPITINSNHSHSNKYQIDGIVMNHPDPSIPNGTHITIQKFITTSSSTNSGTTSSSNKSTTCGNSHKHDNEIDSKMGSNLDSKMSPEELLLDLTQNDDNDDNDYDRNSNSRYNALTSFQKHHGGQNKRLKHDNYNRNNNDHELDIAKVKSTSSLTTSSTTVAATTTKSSSIHNNNVPPNLQSGDFITSIRINSIQYRLGTKKGDTNNNYHNNIIVDVTHDDDGNNIDNNLNNNYDTMTPVQQILQVFPDMDINHIKKHLLQNGLQHCQLDNKAKDQNNINIDISTSSSTSTSTMNGCGNNIQLIIESTLQILASQPSYPKSKVDFHNMNDNTNALTTTMTTKFLHDYSSSSTSYPQSQLYKTNAHSYLYYIFPFLSSNGTSYLLQKFNSKYYLTYMYIIDQLKKGCKDAVENTTATTINTTTSNNTPISLKEYYNDLEIYQYHNITNIIKGRQQSITCKLLPQQIKALELQIPTANHTRTMIINPTVAHPRRNNHLKQNQLPSITDPILLNEISYTNHKLREWMTSVETKIHRLQLRRQSEIDGTTIECNCCYVDCAFEEMVHCVDEGHLFCVDCVRRHAETQIFGNGKLGVDSNGNLGELNCMDVNGCTSYFARSALMKALPIKVMEKYDELQANQNLEKVGLKDLSKCPKCDFQAIVPETEQIFDCPQCQHKSCRKCGEDPHIPLRCEEVEKKDETNARIRVEEAMTKARVRHCPNGCKQPFYKVEGCNKMTCPTCKSFICYICRKLIPKSVSYKHFCQKPHCKHQKCGQCTLYSNAEEDDKQAAKEAGLKTLEEIQRENQVTDGGSGDNDKTKRIDVDELLRMPGSSTNGTHNNNNINRVHHVAAAMRERRHVVLQPHEVLLQAQLAEQAGIARARERIAALQAHHPYYHGRRRRR